MLARPSLDGDDLPGRYLVVVDAGTNHVVSASEAFAALLGYTPDEMRGRDVWTYTRNEPERRETVQRNIDEAPETVVDVTVLIARDGSEVEVRYTLHKLGPLLVTIVNPLDEEPSLTRLQRIAVELITRRARLDAARRRERADHPSSPPELRALPQSRRSTG
jgi:PAS domain-containing protein